MNPISVPFYALLVGIDRYLSPKIPPLAGCVNDVAVVERLLCDKFQVEAGHILKLTDHQATHAAIKQAFRERLLQPARAWAEAGRAGAAPVLLFRNYLPSPITAKLSA